ncbi:MAG TPA: tetratricopeptide repeat protein, partial [Spirochaetia bacterium]|nr:tetratricopeptide repeat protein [Spirochaetia bacterium]
IGLHTGEAEVRDNDYFGPTVNRVARLQSVAFGGQTILSLVTEELVRDYLPEGVILASLGTHRLKDLTRPETVFELRIAEQNDTFPELKSLDAHLHNLPMEPTPLIGREEELERLEKELLGSHVHLLTLVGPGGIGKTRMGLQIAADLIDSFPDGVYVIDLASIREPSEIPQAIVETLKIKESPNGSVAERLIEYLGKRRMLLVLDNFEQVIEGSGEVSRLLSKCPEVKIIVTSREALHLRGEHVFHVPTLGLPTATERFDDVKGWSQYEAVRLFIDRALDQDPNFAVTNTNAPAIAEICVRLDGLPLAIELAAARIGFLSPQELLKHLSTRLGVLTGGPRDLPNRQQALRTTIDWSYNLLTAAEKTQFANLSIFSGSFSLDACRGVCDRNGTDFGRTLQLTQSLVDKSLIVMTTQSGGSRFHMLETIREYGLERLALLPEAQTLARSHADYYLSMVETASSRMEAADQNTTFEMIDFEIANIRSMSKFFSEANDFEMEARAYLSLGRYWQVRGFYTEGRKHLRSVFARTETVREETIGRAKVWCAILAREQGDYDRAKLLLDDLLSNNLEDKALRTSALHEAAWTAVRIGDFRNALNGFERAIETANETNDELYIWKSRLGKGVANQVVGDKEAARRDIEECMAYFHDNGYPRLEAQALVDLGYASNERGELEKAGTIFERLLPVCDEIGDLYLRSIVLNNLGDNYLQRKKYEQAVDRYAQCLSLACRAGNQMLSLFALSGRAEALQGLGRTEEALGVADESIEIINAAEMKSGVEPAYALIVAADLKLKNGEQERAASLYGQAIPMLEKAGHNELLLRAREGYQSASDQ